ncbi:amidohydrolase family protein [Streptomyces sp. NPDC002088]|uniref:amidohydrolase family protein n=1 Tax=unclassified Streptomyces TaxID=2593676 RepID=UPI00331E253C
MRTIALEEHFLSRDIAARAGGPGEPWADALDDLGEGRLAVMDAAGIDVQVLSLVAHGVQELDPAPALELSRLANDRMAATIAAHPGRFAAFATLPMSDPPAAVEELRRAIGDLGFVGAMIHGQTRGVFLDDPSMAPVLAAAEELGVPIYLHPGEPPQAVYDAYFSGLAPAVAARLSTAAWGWHAECGLHVLRLAATGVFDRFPGLQLIVGHMGEMLPFSLARADQRLNPVVDLAASVADTVREHVHLTTTGYVTIPPLLCALMVFGADRILFAVDHPFSDSREGTAFLYTAPLSPVDLHKIAHTNAEALLGIY